MDIGKILLLVIFFALVAIQLRGFHPSSEFMGPQFKDFEEEIGETSR